MISAAYETPFGLLSFAGQRLSVHAWGFILTALRSKQPWDF